jgi:hypothetical protein
MCFANHKVRIWFVRAKFKEGQAGRLQETSISTEEVYDNS